jgi:hypothetical protein
MHETLIFILAPAVAWKVVKGHGPIYNYGYQDVTIGINLFDRPLVNSLNENVVCQLLLSDY